MRFYTPQHQFYCGIDLHARAMYVCIMDQSGKVLVHKNLPTQVEAFLRTIATYQGDIVVAVECVFTWYWIAECFNDPLVEKSIDVDVQLPDTYEKLIRNIELEILRKARQHNPIHLHLLRPIPGVVRFSSW